MAFKVLRIALWNCRYLAGLAILVGDVENYDCNGDWAVSPLGWWV